jgi:hypothetical protein
MSAKKDSTLLGKALTEKGKLKPFPILKFHFGEDWTETMKKDHMRQMTNEYDGIVEDWYAGFVSWLQSLKKECKSPFCDGVYHDFLVNGEKHHAICPYNYVEVKKVLGMLGVSEEDKK